MESKFTDAFFQPAFPFDGNHLVAASAGTGKTYNIANLFAALVMDRGLRVSEILVVTFTDAATRELRSRLRGVLADLQRELKDGSGNKQSKALVSRLPADPAVRAAACSAVDAAALEFDCAAIFTIHSFCGRALQRYAFESGLAFDAEPPAEVKSAQLDRAARDWWRTHVTLGHDPAFAAFLDGNAAATFTLENLQGLLGDLSMRPTIAPARPSVPDPAPDSAEAANAALLRIAFGLFDEWLRGQPSRKSPDFDDVLLGMRRALEDRDRGPVLVRALRAEYGAVLIDEFQDTDPVQYGIFRRAFAEGEGAVPVFFVGDPKQAIYAFRGGDVFAYREAVGTVPEDRRYGLFENHRSTPGVIAAVNDLFRDETPGSTFGDDTIAYSGSVVACGGKFDFDLCGDGRAIHFVRVAQKKDRLAVCADEIASLLAARPMLRTIDEDGKTSERPLRADDVAILARGLADGKGPRLIRLLEDRGVRAVMADKRRSVFGEPEAESFRLLLAAIAAPSSATGVRAALLTPVFGLDAGTLARLADGEELPRSEFDFPFLDCRPDPQAPVAMTDFLRLFHELSGRWRESGFLAAFDLLAARSGFRSRLAARRGGERSITNLLHLAEIVHSETEGAANGPSALLDWFAQRSKDAGDESILRLESEGGAVRIMTIHHSKGLQFPVVVMPDADTAHDPTDNALHVFHQDGSIRAAPGFDPEAAAAEAKEADDEAMRLLYVGLTRAAWKCIVLAPSEEAGASVALAFDRLFARAAQCPGTVRIRDAQPLDPPPSVPPEPAPAAAWLPPRTPPKLPTDGGRGSYSSLSPASHAPRGGVDATLDAHDSDAGGDAGPLVPEGPGTADERTSDHPIFGFPGGAAVGDCWHKILEEADFAAPADALRPLVEKKLLAAGRLRCPPDERAARTDAVLEMVERTLSLPLEAPDGSVFRLRDVPAEDRVSEWQFDFSSRAAAATTASLRKILERHWGAEPDGSDHRAFLDSLAAWNKPIPKGFLTGFIDLAFRRDGRYYVVDWKSNSLRRREAAFSHAGLRAEMTAHAYFLQYLIYAAVLHRHLRDSLPGYRWEDHFGGVRYVFLRGAAIGREAVCSDRPSEALLDEFGAALGLSAKGASA